MPHGRNKFRSHPVGGGAGLEYHQAARHLPLISSATPMTAPGHSRVLGHHRLDSAGGQPMARHVDHIVDTAHDEQVAVLVEIAPSPVR